MQRFLESEAKPCNKVERKDYLSGRDLSCCSIFEERLTKPPAHTYLTLKETGEFS